MHFHPNGHMDEPVHLFQREDGFMSSVLKEEYRHMFEHSAFSSFFAYLPLYFWQQVWHETNNYASVNAIPIKKHFTMLKLMSCFGILFYMEVTVKGEYANYWGNKQKIAFLVRVESTLKTVCLLNDSSICGRHYRSGVKFLWRHCSEIHYQGFVAC
ncbi:unnamed protein product [Phytophthora fragariaefolia]|uniref:Unnamed protein product n=1 Tax=Phytophthora fragariaefolia TaxID=1490495 RepID=A0A9W7CVH1_9STRA|nr:unnamed protein product [Phytophthora fragariaefolia]